MNILFTLLVFLLPPLSYSNYNNEFDKYICEGYSMYYYVKPLRANVSINADYLNYQPSLFTRYSNSFQKIDHSNIKFITKDMHWLGGNVGIKFKF
jgi:hypothetical protein